MLLSATHASKVGSTWQRWESHCAVVTLLHSQKGHPATPPSAEKNCRPWDLNLGPASPPVDPHAAAEHGAKEDDQRADERKHQADQQDQKRAAVLDTIAGGADGVAHEARAGRHVTLLAEHVAQPARHGAMGVVRWWWCVVVVRGNALGVRG